MAGVRTPIRQYASCVLVDVDDTLPSIFSSDMAIGNYVAQRAGIGIKISEESIPELEEIVRLGVIPFLNNSRQQLSAAQNGVRGYSKNSLPYLAQRNRRHYCIVKNNKGTEDNRVRKLDYSGSII